MYNYIYDIIMYVCKSSGVFADPFEFHPLVKKSGKPVGMVETL